MRTAASLLSMCRRRAAAAIVVLCLGSGCGHTSPAGTAQSTGAATSPATPPTTSSSGAPTSATGASIKRATDTLEAYRSAAGGGAVSRVLSLEVIGASASSATGVTRSLHCLATFPGRYRQEEAPGSGQASALPLRGATARGRGPTGVMSPGAASPDVIFGLDDDHGWMSGAKLAGTRDAKSAAHEITVVARQSFVDFMAGVLPTWLLDGAHFTFTDEGVVDAGADRGAIILQIEGPDGHAGRLLIDPTTHLPHRLTVDRSLAEGASAVGLIVTYSDYRDVSGVLLPHKMTRETDTAITTTWSIAHYVVNGKISPQAFLAPRNAPRKK